MREVAGNNGAQDADDMGCRVRVPRVVDQGEEPAGQTDTDEPHLQQ